MITAKRYNIAPYLLSMPALIFIGLLFLLPVGALILTSFQSPDGSGKTLFTLSVYERLFEDPYVLQLAWRTAKVSLITTFTVLVLAFPVAVHLRQVSARTRMIVSFLLISPLLTSTVVRTLAWVILLSPRGLINSAVVHLGFSPVALIYNDTGIIIGMTHVFFGYMVLSLLTSVLKIDENLLLAANNLGAGSFRVLTGIILPLSLPGILAGSILVFSMCASTYATPALLGGSSAKVLAAEIYDRATADLQWNEAAGLATTLALIIGLIVWGGTRVAEKGRFRGVFK